MKKSTKTYLLLACLCLSVLCLTGCTATWITALGAAIPSISALVTAIATFVAALSGKTVSTSVANAIKKATSDALATLSNIKTTIAAVTGAASAGVVAEIQAGLSSVLTNLQSILSGFSVTDSATVAKFAQLGGLAVAAIQAALALIPIINPEDAAPLTATETTVLEHHMKSFKAEYHTIQSTKTGTVAVDEALATLPSSI